MKEIFRITLRVRFQVSWRKWKERKRKCNFTTERITFLSQLSTLMVVAIKQFSANLYWACFVVKTWRIKQNKTLSLQLYQRATKSTQCRTHSRHNNLLCCHNYYRSAYSHFRYFLGYSQHYRRLCLNGPLKLSSSWTFRQSSWRCWNFFRKCWRPMGRRKHRQSQISMSL